jgi:hypothetical protein
MPTELRSTGIGVLGDMPSGTHFCYFYQTKEDLLGAVVPFFKVGLESNELCVWVLSQPVTREEAIAALRVAVPALDRHMAERHIEFFPAHQWYFQGSRLDLRRATSYWNEKRADGLARGLDGMRGTGDAAWVESKNRRDFSDYEQQLNGSLRNQQMMVLCTYPLGTASTAELLDAARTHHFAVVKRNGGTEVLESSELRHARTEISRLERERDRLLQETRDPLPAPGGRKAVIVPEAEMRARQRNNVLAALEQAKWRLYGPSGAAALLGIAGSTLGSRMKSLGIRRQP